MSKRGISPLTLAVVMALGIETCQGITHNVETLRAQRVEIVDEKGGATMDVATKIRTLEERVQRLEAALEKRQSEERPKPALTKSDVF